jgi:hypothetical protein
MKHKIITGSLAILLLISAGCTKNFDSINTNPNTPETVTSEQYLFPPIIKNALNNYAYRSQFEAAVCGDYYANQYVSGFDDDWTAGSVEGSFQWSLYNQLRDVENLRVLAHNKGDQNNEGAALVLRCWMFQVMTDNFGDLPYTQAVQGKESGIFAAPYDKQEVIYAALMDSLKVANNLFATGTDQINGDILMNGNVMRWREFANGLRLRLLMRMSNVTGSTIDVAGEMNAIASDPSTYPVFESYNDQAALEFLSQQGNEFPAYHNNPIGDYHLSTTFKANLDTLNDPRIAYYAMPTPNSFGGAPQYGAVPNCILAQDDATYNGGPNFQSQESPLLMPINAYQEASPIAAQGMILSCAEVQFILAEGKERGLITGGDDAADYYLRGVVDQFSYDSSRLVVLGASGTGIFPTASAITPTAAYYAQPLVAYSGTTEEKLWKIRIQRWFSMFYTGFEGWSEFRRTGVPTQTAAGPNSAISVWPKRVRYPLSEVSYNKANYDAAVQVQGPDDLVTPVWWEK